VETPPSGAGEENPSEGVELPPVKKQSGESPKKSARECCTRKKNDFLENLKDNSLGHQKPGGTYMRAATSLRTHVRIVGEVMMAHEIS